jgi:hypothetical protein
MLKRMASSSDQMGAVKRAKLAMEDERTAREDRSMTNARPPTAGWHQGDHEQEREQPEELGRVHKGSEGRHGNPEEETTTNVLEERVGPSEVGTGKGTRAQTEDPQQQQGKEGTTEPPEEAGHQTSGEMNQVPQPMKDQGTTETSGEKAGKMAPTDRKRGEVSTPDAETMEELNKILIIERAFPQGSTDKANVHPTMTDRVIIQTMRDHRRSGDKQKLKDVDSTVWDRKGNLRKEYHYILKLAASKNAFDSLTAEEKQHFVGATEKQLRHHQFPEAFNASGNIRPRAMTAFIQPRSSEGVLESPVYNPKVIPTEATFSQCLAKSVNTTITAEKMGKQRLSAPLKQVAKDQQALRLREAAFFDIQREFREIYAKKDAAFAARNRTADRLAEMNGTLKNELREAKERIRALEAELETGDQGDQEGREN